MLHGLKKLLKTSETEPDAPLFKVAAHERVYAIGDIHGRADLIKTLYPRLIKDALEHSDGRENRFVFLGDYIDRGEASRDVITALRYIADGPMAAQTEFLIGNHEAAMIDFLADPVKNASWLQFGGLQTLHSYGVSAPITLTSEEAVTVSQSLAEALGDDLGFVQGMKRMTRSGDVVFTHAGYEPGVPLDEQRDTALLWGRHGLLTMTSVPEFCCVHGHFDGPEPVISASRICIDTGAYYSGRLTAIRLDDDLKIIATDSTDGSNT